MLKEEIRGNKASALISNGYIGFEKRDLHRSPTQENLTCGPIESFGSQLSHGSSFGYENVGP